MLVDDELRARVLALLKRIEWVANDSDDVVAGEERYCVACNGYKPGHNPAGCELAALIRELEGEP